MRLFLLFLFLFITSLVGAQDRCLTSTYVEARHLSPTMKATSVSQASFPLEIAKTPSGGYEDGIINIPVVVHVLYNHSSQNISEAQIKSGMEALNRDFRRQNADTVNTPQRFREAAADVKIEFQLAKTDPTGRHTNGIVRKRVSRNGWVSDDKMKHSMLGGSDAWDSKSYLNIWIVNLVGGSGYASVPGSSPDKDGVVIHYASFGTINTAPPFHMGRTAVHEVGHWLGLKHIWGDAQCGDDGVEDTPKQGFFTQGCPSGFRSSCGNGTAGDMYMNYMDYTNDACMNLFTNGQRQRMRSLFETGGQRASFLQSKGLQEPWLTWTAPVAGVSLYPNPASNEVTLVSGSEQVGKTVWLYNNHGQVLRQDRITSLQQTFNIAYLAPGIYFLKGEGVFQKFMKL